MESVIQSAFKKQAILVKCDSELLHGTNSSRYKFSLDFNTLDRKMDGYFAFALKHDDS